MGSLFRRLRGVASGNPPQHPQAQASLGQSVDAQAAPVQGETGQHYLLHLDKACREVDSSFHVCVAL